MKFSNIYSNSYDKNSIVFDDEDPNYPGPDKTSPSNCYSYFYGTLAVEQSGGPVLLGPSPKYAIKPSDRRAFIMPADNDQLS
jgi:hypothetical protein